MTRKPKRGRRALPAGVDSWFEYTLLNGVLHQGNYHPAGISYWTQPVKREYHPDFTYRGKSGTKYIIEAKGRFRTIEEAKKYLDIYKYLKATEPTNIFVFIFQNPEVPMPGS